MRVYLPTTLTDLASAWSAGVVPVAEDAVVSEGDGEEEEYAALDTAADLSAGLLPGGRGRRVVVVAEVAALDEPIAVRRVVAVHADESDVVSGTDSELSWFAPQEVPHLLLDG